MGKVLLENIKAYAHHGCLPQETNIGSDYLVNVSVKTNLSKASTSDQLKDTVDYVHINKIVKQEMAIPSKLLEHVAKRIIDRIFIELPSVEKSKVSVSKINPPINGDVEKVTVTLELNKMK
ncbi:dihydroneopterin aldolase [Maribacter sp. ACAM166]|uniref:dihydroneopterin aldolase n=1 Tax=Maribacter sp. ACAM166 TaxID=2508996 RepID=UPI0010FF3B87|nr:dihydroneopterin aldolase [Maribacter sp. ACAM166]TLP80733.1 dihydroneopterin aldolase [Maribacter sp. ACAM166]